MPLAALVGYGNCDFLSDTLARLLALARAPAAGDNGTVRFIFLSSDLLLNTFLL